MINGLTEVEVTKDPRVTDLVDAFVASHRLLQSIVEKSIYPDVYLVGSQT